MRFTKDDVACFSGGNLLHRDAMLTALNAVDWQPQSHIIEFGSGRSTTRLANLLLQKGLQLTYHTYEHNPKYEVTHPCVCSILYEELPASLDEQPAQLVIVDGPLGLDRCHWYPLLVPYCQPGCVILIDDIDHYAEFQESLDKHFEYETIEYVNRGKPRKDLAMICWKIVRII